eukprot:3206605-Prymnesium_polylepis.1
MEQDHRVTMEEVVANPIVQSHPYVQGRLEVDLSSSAPIGHAGTSCTASDTQTLSALAGPVLQPSQLAAACVRSGAMSPSAAAPSSALDAYVRQFPSLPFERYQTQRLFHRISLDFPGTQLVREEPYIFLVPDLLSASECDKLIVKHASAETQQASGNAQQVASGTRTSVTAYARNDELPALRQRLAKLAN